MTIETASPAVGLFQATEAAEKEILAIVERLESQFGRRIVDLTLATVDITSDADADTVLKRFVTLEVELP